MGEFTEAVERGLEGGVMGVVGRPKTHGIDWRRMSARRTAEGLLEMMPVGEATRVAGLKAEAHAADGNVEGAEWWQEVVGVIPARNTESD